ncbi:MAG: PilZ domain-containing protein [Phycisphaerae bacterium]
MSSPPAADRRQFARRPLALAVRFHHVPTGREFPGRCIDISAGGMLMHIPPTAPVLPGQEIRIDLSALTGPDTAGVANPDTPAEVVRVDRRKLIPLGRIAIGVRFQEH